MAIGKALNRRRDRGVWVPTILSLPLTWCSSAGGRAIKSGIWLREHLLARALSVLMSLRFAYLVVLRVFRADEYLFAGRHP